MKNTSFHHAVMDAYFPKDSHVILILVFALMIRSIIGLWDYSGHATPPMYGDFEAQRHWMEITIHTPIKEWYVQTNLNDLQYWGLDYPPLTAYVSYVFGILATFIYPDLVELTKSRGHESENGKTFMRNSVLLCDCLIFFPAICYFIHSSVYTPLTKEKRNENRQSVMSHTSINKWSTLINPNIFYKLLLLVICTPALCLIDHGHFQYNNVCLGLSIAAMAAILNDCDLFGAFLFSCALNFKQMTLYYAPVFFCCLFRKCVTYQANKSMNGFIHLLKIGSVVILTFAVLWLPVCYSPKELYYGYNTLSCGATLGGILHRIFPFSRGIFEDKVANIWFGVSILYNIRLHWSLSQLKLGSTLLTLVLISPVCYDLLRRPLTPTRALLSLTNCSLAFFLASFQVHEKSLLLVLTPLSLLIVVNYQCNYTNGGLLSCNKPPCKDSADTDRSNSIDMVVAPEQRIIHEETNQMFIRVIKYNWYAQTIGCFSMFPLLVRDGLRIPYYCCMCSYHLLNYWVLISTSSKLDKVSGSYWNCYCIWIGDSFTNSSDSESIVNNERLTKHQSMTCTRADKIKLATTPSNSKSKLSKKRGLTADESAALLQQELLEKAEFERKLKEKNRKQMDLLSKLMVYAYICISIFGKSLLKIISVSIIVLLAVIVCLRLIDVGVFMMQCAEFYVPNPSTRYPDLYPVLIALFSLCQLIVLYLYTIHWQLFQLSARNQRTPVQRSDQNKHANDNTLKKHQ